MRPFRSAAGGDRGMVAVIVAVLLVVFIGLSAFVVDMGFTYNVRRQLQNAADAAALAGCRVLIEQLTNSEAVREDAIRSAAREYADLNGVDSSTVLDEDIIIGPDLDYVQVSVRRDASYFFGPILWALTESDAPDEPWTQTRHARAKIGYLTGMSGLVPFGAPILRADDVRVEIGGTESALADQGSGEFAGSFSSAQIAALSSNTGHKVNIKAYNGQTGFPPGDQPSGVVEVYEDVARLNVVAAENPLAGVRLSPNVVTADGSVTSVELVVDSSAAPEYRLATGPWQELTLKPDGSYSTTLQVDEAPETLYKTVGVRLRSGGVEISDWAVSFPIRRTTHPLLEVELSDYVVRADDAKSVQVRVKLHEYRRGEEYVLPLGGGGAVVGNFAAVNLAKVWRPPNYVEPLYDIKGEPFGDYVATGFPGDLRINDVFLTLQGAKVGGLSAGIKQRFGSEVFATDAAAREAYKTWDEERYPSRRIIYVPVVEKMERLKDGEPVDSAQQALQLVDFAAFWVTTPADPNKWNPNNTPVRGVFIDYGAPGTAYEEDPGSDLFVMMPYLTAEGLPY